METETNVIICSITNCIICMVGLLVVGLTMAKRDLVAWMSAICPLKYGGPSTAGADRPGPIQHLDGYPQSGKGVKIPCWHELKKVESVRDI